MSCSCEPLEPLAPWQRPLLTQRKGYRSDARSARLRDSIVNGRRVHPADSTAYLAEDAEAGRSMCAGFKPGQVLTQRGLVTDLPRSARGDEAESPWHWGSEPTFGGGGTQRVGPGWSTDAPRFDSGEVEVLIGSTRCIETPQGWRTVDGDPCPLAEA